MLFLGRANRFFLRRDSRMRRREVCNLNFFIFSRIPTCAPTIISNWNNTLLDESFTHNLIDCHNLYFQERYSRISVSSSSFMLLNQMNKTMRQIQPIRGATTTHSSAPIKCPKSKCQEDEDYLQNYNRDVKYYNSLTWAMYNRITNARAKRQTMKSKCQGTSEPRHTEQKRRENQCTHTCSAKEEHIFPIEM
jgi:hypothetical protein